MPALPVTWFTDISTYAGDIMTEYWPIVALVLGIAMGFSFLGRITSFVKSAFKG